MTREARGFGHAKVILLGEHAVVHGHPALAAALDLGVRAQVEAAGGPKVSIPAWKVELDLRQGGDGELERALLRLFATAPTSAQSASVWVSAEVPSRAGLGSSAALSVALSRALSALDGEHLEPAEAERRAGIAEEIFHGKASGIDAAVAARGGLLRFVRGRPPQELESAALPAVVALVEKRAPTREMVERVGEARAREPERVEGLFARIGELVAEATDALSINDTKNLGRLMTENHVLLRALGVSSPALDDACESAVAAGALGSKLTGAGGGGCMVALAPGCAEAVAEALSSRAQWVRVVRLGGG